MRSWISGPLTCALGPTKHKSRIVCLSQRSHHRSHHDDLDAGTILTPARSTKQKKDHKAFIPPVVAERLRRIKRFSPLVFQWSYGDLTLYRQFFTIQKAAGIKLTCTGDHEPTEHCHFYRYHDFRRSFATLNEALPESMPTNQMGHWTCATTQRYRQLAKKQQNYAGRIYLPPSMPTRAAN